MNQQEIGKFIAKCRKEKNLTQIQLAEKLGVTDKSISRWENGKTMPDMSLYEPLCRILDIHISELLYAKRMNNSDKVEYSDNLALSILKTRSKIETFSIFTEILIVVGILITITLTKILADTTIEMLFTILTGGFIWAFGIFLRIQIKKAIIILESNN